MRSKRNPLRWLKRRSTSQGNRQHREAPANRTSATTTNGATITPVNLPVNIQIYLLGNKGVGKTHDATRFSAGRANQEEESFQRFTTRKMPHHIIEIENKMIKDVPTNIIISEAQTRDTMSSRHVDRTAHIFMIYISMNESSATDINKLHELCERYGHESANVIIVANKVDVPEDQWSLTPEEIMESANSYNIPVFFHSATKENCQRAIELNQQYYPERGDLDHYLFAAGLTEQVQEARPYASLLNAVKDRCDNLNTCRENIDSTIKQIIERFPDRHKNADQRKAYNSALKNSEEFQAAEQAFEDAKGFSEILEGVIENRDVLQQLATDLSSAGKGYEDALEEVNNYINDLAPSNGHP